MSWHREAPEERCDFIHPKGDPCGDLADVWVVWNGHRIGQLCWVHWRIFQASKEGRFCTFEEMPWRKAIREAEDSW